MAKIESTFKNMFIVLLLITGITAAALGGVYNVTKGPIAASKLKAQEDAIKSIFSDFDNNPIDEALNVSVGEETVKLFPAKKASAFQGAAVETFTTKGFSGYIKVMVGFDTNGRVVNYQVLEHKETPGLGSKMQEWFRAGGGNVIGKNPSDANFKVSKDGGNIDAITAATISSRAFIDAIQTAYKEYKKADLK